MRRALVGLLVLAAAPASGATIQIGPADGDTAYALIESAMPGDEVVIAPGTYHFRVYLENSGSPGRPIVIRARDPANRPVWDLGAGPVEDAPGSYTAGDRGRGCWQITGSHYRVSGIVMTNCRGARPGGSAGMRVYGDAQDVLISDCIFRDNDNGLTGGSLTSDFAAEFCEFDHNGNTAADPPTHNVYVYAGNFAIRYSYLHDSTQGMNLHCRALNCTAEYNWFARAASFEGQFDSDDYPPPAPFTQNVLLRGNVVVQNASPANTYKVFTLYNDEGLDESFALRAINNTFVGNGGHAAFVQFANADGTAMSAELSNNIFFGTTVAAVAGDAAKATLTGTNNWVMAGTDTTGLSASVVGAAPGFDAAGGYTLGGNSPCIGKAAAGVTGLPVREYYRDETLARMYRPRATVDDIGAFEHDTTGPGIGPYGATPIPGDDGGVTPITDGSTAMTDGAGSVGSDGGAPAGSTPQGCSCRTGGRGESPSWLIAVIAAATCRRCRRRPLVEPTRYGKRRRL